MARDSAFSPESFEEILVWLNPDRELAGKMYVQLRRDLAKLFVWGRCSDPEGLTDEVFDRVAKKVHQVRQTYVGDPRLYFRAVAKNLIKENFTKLKTHLSFEDIELSFQQITETEDDIVDLEECLHSCLRELSDENREVILNYYAKQKQAKIDHRNQMARRLEISVETLRVRAFRIRAALEGCIERCLQSQAHRK